MSAYSLDLRERIVESVKKGVPKAESARDVRGFFTHCGYRAPAQQL